MILSYSALSNTFSVSKQMEPRETAGDFTPKGRPRPGGNGQDCEDKNL